MSLSVHIRPNIDSILYCKIKSIHHTAKPYTKTILKMNIASLIVVKSIFMRQLYTKHIPVCSLQTGNLYRHTVFSTIFTRRNTQQLLYPLFRDGGCDVEKVLNVHTAAAKKNRTYWPASNRFSVVWCDAMNDDSKVRSTSIWADSRLE